MGCYVLVVPMKKTKQSTSAKR